MTARLQAHLNVAANPRGAAVAAASLSGGIILLATASKGQASVSGGYRAHLSLSSHPNGQSVTAGTLLGFGPGAVTGKATATATFTVDVIDFGTATLKGAASVAGTTIAHVSLSARAIAQALVVASLQACEPRPIDGTTSVQADLTYDSLGLEAQSHSRAWLSAGIEILHHGATGRSSVSAEMSMAGTAAAASAGAASAGALLDVEGPFEVGAQAAAAAMKTVTVNVQAAKSTYDPGPTPSAGWQTRPHVREVDFI